MDFLQAATYGALIFYVAAFFAALIVIIFVHEFGHFIIGRWCGVNVEAFSIGFGKEIFGFHDRYGTRWKFCQIPIGGYVRFEGDANAASLPSTTPRQQHSPTSLHGQPVLKRMAIVAAGPIANFILAIAIFTYTFMAIGLPYVRPIVSEVAVNSAASKAGFMPGDEIKTIDGSTITSFTQIQESVFLRPGETVVIVVDRKGASMALNVVPEAKEVNDGFGGTMKIGQLGIRHNAAPDEPLRQRFNLHQAVGKAVERTWFNIHTTLRFLGKIFTGSQSVKQIGGIGSIGKGAGDAASGGALNFMYYIGFLSVSIGLFNLFPIPMLDGGHLVFYAIEAVRGKPVGPAAQEWGFRIGFSCVLMLMLLGLFNDVNRFATLFGAS